jgi:hypothetical protein
MSFIIIIIIISILIIITIIVIILIINHHHHYHHNPAELLLPRIGLLQWRALMRTQAHTESSCGRWRLPTQDVLGCSGAHDRSELRSTTSTVDGCAASATTCSLVCRCGVSVGAMIIEVYNSLRKMENEKDFRLFVIWGRWNPRHTFI